MCLCRSNEVSFGVWRSEDRGVRTCARGAAHRVCVWKGRNEVVLRVMEACTTVMQMENTRMFK